MGIITRLLKQAGKDGDEVRKKLYEAPQEDVNRLVVNKVLPQDKRSVNDIVLSCPMDDYRGLAVESMIPNSFFHHNKCIPFWLLLTKIMAPRTSRRCHARQTGPTIRHEWIHKKYRPSAIRRTKNDTMPIERRILHGRPWQSFCTCDFP